MTEGWVTSYSLLLKMHRVAIAVNLIEPKGFKKCISVSFQYLIFFAKLYLIFIWFLSFEDLFIYSSNRGSQSEHVSRYFCMQCGRDLNWGLKFSLPQQSGMLLFSLIYSPFLCIASVQFEFMSLNSVSSNKQDLREDCHAFDDY